jgi:peptidyl-prolyl cis-trans isomerase SurA
MKKILYILIFILNFNNLLALESKIIYKIQNEIITNIDIKNEYNYLLALNNNLKKLDKEKIFNIAKDSIIREKIKKIELEKNFIKLDIDDRYLNKLVENIYLRLNLRSTDDFKKYLKTYNIDLQTVIKKIKIDALWNTLIIKKYDSKVKINLDKIKNTIKNRKALTKNFLLSEIVFEIENKEELKMKYTEILNSIDQVGFENTVSIYSIANTNKTGGGVGWVDVSSLNNEIRDNIISLNVGDISSPFIIPGGVLILKINDIKEEVKEIDFDFELKKAITFERNKQLNQYSKIYFNKTKKNFDFND